MKRFRGDSLLLRVPLLFAASEASLVGSILLFADHPWLAGGALASVVATFVLGSRSSRIDVGTEGVSIEWLGWRRFFARGDIERAETYESGFLRRHRRTGVTLTLVDGSIVQVPSGKEDAGRICRAIREVLSIDGTSAPGAAAVALSRGELSTEEWLARLRRVGAAGTTDGVRGAAVSHEQLWGVVSDPTALAADRAAAALALRVEPAEETKPRLLRIATETVDPDLRTLLERTAAEAATDEELEAAFVAFDEKTKER